MTLELFTRIYLEPACKELARKLINAEPLTEAEKPVFGAYLWEMQERGKRN